MERSATRKEKAVTIGVDFLCGAGVMAMLGIVIIAVNRGSRDRRLVSKLEIDKLNRLEKNLRYASYEITSNSARLTKLEDRGSINTNSLKKKSSITFQVCSSGKVNHKHDSSWESLTIEEWRQVYNYDKSNQTTERNIKLISSMMNVVLHGTSMDATIELTPSPSLKI